MKETDLSTLEQVKQFVSGTESVSFRFSAKDESYRWIERSLIRFGYLQQSKADKGLIRAYLCKISGYSRQQITRLIGQYRTSGTIKRKRSVGTGFQRHYTAADIRLLSELDQLHSHLSGPATKKLCERAYQQFGDERYQRLSTISVSHLYNLRQTTTYQRSGHHYNKTRPVRSPIGERRKPQAQGKPGYIRIDTVHQGNLDQCKGVYHINAVDEVTQFELITSVERISEAYMLPALSYLLETFPFVIQGFHSDNGSEYINKRVAELLNKLLIEFTKSRARQSNDNALVESKNGSVVRKHWGYSHIPQHYAQQLNELNHDYLNPYLNFHRPCFFAMTLIDAKGKQRKTYPYQQMMTPYDKLKSLPQAQSYLKAGLSFEQLDEIAYQISDNEAARQLQQTRQQLFRSITEQESQVA